MHKHERIREQLLERMAQLPADTRLPDERELAEQFGVSRATVRQALGALASEDKIYAIRGRGTFVAAQRIAKGLQLTSFTQDMQNRGLTPGTRLIAAEEIAADSRVARKLELGRTGTVLHLKRLRLADGEPMCFEEIWLPARLYPDLLSQDLERPLYGLLQERYNIRIESADQTISAAVMPEEVSDLLALPWPSAGIVVTRRGFDGRSRAAEFGRSIYRGDRYDFEFLVDR